MLRNRRGTAAAVVAVLMVATACGSDDEGTSTDTAAAPTSTAAASTPGNTVSDGTTADTSAPDSTTVESGTGSGPASGTPITLMVTGTFEGPGLGYPEATAGAQAAADAINAAGGIDGHPIEIEVCDDHYDANQAAACVEKAVDQGVTAFVGAVEFFAAQVMPTVEAAGIPWIAPVAVSGPMFSSPMSFPVDGGGLGPQVAMGRQAVREGGERVVVVSIDHAGALSNEVWLKTGIELEGGQEVGLVKYPPGNVDFSSTAASIMSKDPDAVLCLCSSQVDWSSLFKSLTQAGFEGPFSTSVTFMTKEILGTLDDSVDQVFLIDGQRPFDSPNPDMAQYQSEINEYAPESAVRNQIMGGAWLGVHLVADALKGADAYDAATLVEALTASDEFPTYGLVSHIAFTGPAADPELPRLFNVDQILMKYDASNDSIVAVTDEFFDPFAAAG